MPVVNGLMPNGLLNFAPMLSPLVELQSSVLCLKRFPGSAHRDIIGEFAARLYLKLRAITEWALRNWLPTLTILVGLIYWAGRQQRMYR